jgi:hypothetical protein
MPQKDSLKYSYTPIMQNYHQEIKPIIDEFEKQMQVINFSTILVSDDEQKNYTDLFK